MRLGACFLICVREVVLDFLGHIFGYIFVVEEFKDCLCLLRIDAKELTILINTLRVKGFMKCFLNFETIAFLYFASELTFKRDWNPGCVELFHPFVDIFLSGHSNLNKARHDWIR